jgi:hypothetical protein
MRAAARWVRLLRRSTLNQAASLIRVDPAYTDITQTQYSSALDWLRLVGFLTEDRDGLILSPATAALPEGETSQLLFERTVQRSAPSWLSDSDLLIPDTNALPQDAAAIAATLGLSDTAALWAIRSIHGRVDVSHRTELGAAGERALIALLEIYWPGATVHVSATDDGFGYDVLFRHAGIEWHLEVKTTLRRGRLVVYVSRHEYEVSLRDPYWQLVVVGLNERRLPCAVATVQHLTVFARNPRDVSSEARWQSVSHQLMANDLQGGLSFIDVPIEELRRGLSTDVAAQPDPTWGRFAWMPQ